MIVRVEKSQLAVIALLVTSLPGLPAQQPAGQDTQALAQQAQSAFAEGQYSVAEKDYNELLQKGARSAAVYSNLGVVYLREGKLDSAVAMLDKAKSLAPSVAGIRLNLGLAYFRRREFKKASNYFAEVLSMDAGKCTGSLSEGGLRFYDGRLCLRRPRFRTAGRAGTKRP